MKRLSKIFIKSLVDYPLIYERGVDYFESGMIKKVIELDNIIKAEVEGSSFNSYKVKIIFDDDKIHYSCSCPFGGVCKHIVAVLLQLENGKNKVKESDEKLPNWHEKLSLLNKDELIKLLLPYVTNDSDVKVAIFNMLEKRGIDIYQEKFYELWKEICEAIDNSYDYDTDYQEEDINIYYNLEEISKLFKKGKLSSEIKDEFIDDAIEYAIYDKIGISDDLIESVFKVANCKKDWLRIIERLRGKESRWIKELIMKIYKDHLRDNKNYLKERKKELIYGSDYYDLAKFYKRKKDIKKTIEIAKEGIENGEGRKTELYIMLFEHYKNRDYEEAMKYLKELFMDEPSLNEYKKLLSFSKNKKNDAIWAISFFKKKGYYEKLAEIDLYEKRYKNVLDYVMKGGVGYFDNKDKYANKLKELYPKKIIQFYKRKVQVYIEQKKRSAYSSAAIYIKKIRNIYKNILKNENSYKEYISKLSEKYKRLPAFLDEIRHL
ncbi:SWIM zinc finger family protein [bacterium]|nr:SWIM zinc finger family protein [bacterium]